MCLFSVGSLDWLQASFKDFLAKVVLIFPHSLNGKGLFFAEEKNLAYTRKTLKASDEKTQLT